MKFRDYASRHTPSAVGVDFGTTNSALAVSYHKGRPQIARFRFESGTTNVFRSVLFFEEPEIGSRLRLNISAGSDALRRYVEIGGYGRLMQSLKTFLASRHVTKTQIFDSEYDLAQLISYFLRQLREQAEAQFGPLPKRVVAGRPVRFSHATGPEDDARAEARLRNAFSMAGFGDVVFELEPVAAARSYEQELRHDEVVLVADFGGGTSDFSIIRLGPSFIGAETSDRVIGVAGIGIAGDELDARVVEHVVAPALGKGLKYRPDLMNWMPVPAWIYSKLSHWHELAMLRSPKNKAMLHNIRNTVENKGPIDALLYLIENELGFAMTSRIQMAKACLSTADEATFTFADGPIDISRDISLSDFQEWIKREVAAIVRCLDGLLSESGMSDVDIDRVFLTGGSSRVRRITEIFENRFPGKVASGDQMTSVASGLALSTVELL